MTVSTPSDAGSLTRGARLILLLLTGLSLVSRPANAQFRMAPRPDLSDAATRACVAALPPSDFTPALVSLGAGGERIRDSAAVQALFLLAQDVATRVREQLGAPAGVVPVVDSTVPWTAVWGRLEGRIHLDGLVTVDPHAPRSAIDSLAMAGDSLIERAVRSLLEEGETWPFEPTEWALSWPFTIFFVAPDATEDNSSLKSWRALGIPVFSRALPRYAPVMWKKEPSTGPDMRRWDRLGMFSDSVTLQFSYGASGLVDVQTARVVPHRDDVPLLALDLGFPAPNEPLDARRRARSHDAFLASMTASLDGLTWTVGRIGSCPLPRVAYQAFRVRFAERR